MSVFPTWLMPAIVPDTTQAIAPKYLSSWAFDFGTEDFVLDGSGTPVTTDGYASWAVWCVKACLIQRNAYPIYSSNYGCDITSITSASDHAATEAAARQAITSALRADPRTGSVSNFTFVWDGDALTVQFTVSPAVPTVGIVNARLTYS